MAYSCNIPIENPYCSCKLTRVSEPSRPRGAGRVELPQWVEALLPITFVVAAAPDQDPPHHPAAAQGESSSRVVALLPQPLQ